MKHRHWIVPALLLAAIAIAAEPPTPDPAQRAQERAASNAYYAELAERLSQSSNPRHLIIAARLLGRVGAGPKTGADARTVAVTPSAEALLARAIELGATDPWIWWMIAGDCPAAASHCDRALARAKLRELAPSNAVVWMLRDDVAKHRAGHAPSPEDDARDDEALERISAASRVDLYRGESVRTYLDAYDQFPLPASFPISEELFDAPPSLEFIRELLAFFDAGMEGLPRSFSSHPGCEAATVERLGQSRKNRCIAAAQAIWREADTAFLARASNRELLRQLAAGADRDSAMRAGRALAWRQAALMEFNTAGRDEFRINTGFLEDEIALWREPGATELDVMRRQLEAAGIALEPPPDWTPSHPIDPLQVATED